MASQIIKLNKKSAVITTKTGKQMTVKVNSLQGLRDVADYMESQKDIKAVFEFYGPQFKNEQYWENVRRAYVPTAAEKKATAKEVAARKKAWSTPAHQKWVAAEEARMVADPGFMPTYGKVTRREVDENMDEALQAYYGVA